MRTVPLLILLFTAVVFRLPAQNTLWIKSENDERFFVYLDTKQYNDSARSSVVISGLAAAKYKVKIRFLKKAPVIEEVIPLMNTNKKSAIQFEYNIVNNKGKPGLEFFGETPLPMGITKPAPVPDK